MDVRRLLLVTSNFGGGTGKHVAGMLRHVDRERWRVAILCQGVKEVEPPAHVALTELRRSGAWDRFPLAQIRRLRHLRRHVDAEEPDLVHAYFFWPIVYGRWLKLRGRIRYLVENREDEGFNWSPWNYRILRATSHIPDRVICVSEAVRQTVLEREDMDEERAVVVHNGIELPQASSRAEKMAAREELGFTPSSRVVGMVSNLNRAVKGVGHFVEAMPRILGEVPEARFLILGGGPDEGSLRARARTLGVDEHVVFAGFRPNIERFYPIMDVSVLTSLSEGLSMTLLESMSHGLPIVATRVGGNPEVVVDGKTGYLVPPGDPERFASRVVALLRDEVLRERMGKAARRRVEEKFTLRKTATCYEEVYERILVELHPS